MKNIAYISLFLTITFLFNACDSSVGISGGEMKSTEGRSMGSLSGDEDLSTLLREGSFTTIKIDLDAYRYDQPSSQKDYKIDMTFDKKRVTGLADCNRFSANYRVKDDELSFSKVHIEPANDLATCVGFPYADEAINAFLTDEFILSGVSKSSIALDSQNHETSVILSY